MLFQKFSKGFGESNDDLSIALEIYLISLVFIVFKLLVRVMQQKCIGQLTKKLLVLKLVLIHTPFMQSLNMLISILTNNFLVLYVISSTNLNKVKIAILVGGPNWLTSLQAVNMILKL